MAAATFIEFLFLSLFFICLIFNYVIVWLMFFICYIIFTLNLILMTLMLSIFQFFILFRGETFLRTHSFNNIVMRSSTMYLKDWTSLLIIVTRFTFKVFLMRIVANMTVIFLILLVLFGMRIFNMLLMRMIMRFVGVMRVVMTVAMS